MYFYSIYGWGSNLTLYHQKKFTKEEFDKMCEETPKLVYECEEQEFSYYDVELISEYLTNNYGFKKIEYVEGFFIDKE